MMSAGNCPFCVVSPEFGPAYHVFGELSAWVDEDYAARIPVLHSRWKTMEESGFRYQETLEKSLLEDWKDDPAYVREILERYSHGVVSQAVQQARMILAPPVEDEH